MIPHKYWLKTLPVLFLAATFEHCYSILSLYNSGLIFPAFTTILLVLAIDSSIYFSMLVIDLLPAKIILIMSGTISVALNIHYMIQHAPDGTFNFIVAVTVGFLVPGMLSLLGWLAKEVKDKHPDGDSNGKVNLKDVVLFYISRFPDKSDREIADLFGTSHTTVGRYRKG